MLQSDFKLNTSIMREMGLTEGERRRIIDVDDEEICCIGNKDIVAPGCQSGKNAIEFDPINNPRMMNILFANFLDKLSEEGSIDTPCISFGSYQQYGTDKNIARLVFNDSEIMESRAYKTEGLCYAELIFKLNGEDRDLTKYDNINRKQPAKVQAKKINNKKKKK